jgi:hypothetical protein
MRRSTLALGGALALAAALTAGPATAAAQASGTRLVPLGPLAGGDGDFHGTFAVPVGLPLSEFGQVDVSAERWDGNPGHSTLSLLRGATP